MSDQSALHHDVSKLLGFAVKEKATPDGEFVYKLTRNDGFSWVNGAQITSYHGYKNTEADAWAQAPALDALTQPLWIALGSADGDDIAGIVTVEYCPVFQDWTAFIATPLMVSKRSASLGTAIASLFKLVCETGLLDPKTVVLP